MIVARTIDIITQCETLHERIEALAETDNIGEAEEYYDCKEDLLGLEAALYAGAYRDLWIRGITHDAIKVNQLIEAYENG